jgi:hypothetical protein
MSINTMALVEPISLPYIAPASRKVDGLPQDTSIIQATPWNAPSVLATSPVGGYAPLNQPASQADTITELENFVKLECAFFPGDTAKISGRVVRPGFNEGTLISLIRKHKLDRFSTSDTTNFNCLIKELITGYNFIVDLHNYARRSKVLALSNPTNETILQQNERLELSYALMCAYNDGLRRLGTTFEALEDRARREFKGIELTNEVNRLRRLRGRLTQEPHVATKEYNFAHEI